MLPFTRQEKAVLTALIGVIMIGSLGGFISKKYPHRTEKLDFIENWDPQEKIDINRAGKDELIRLPHVGPARAAAIVNFRRQNGDFTDIAELRRVPGIGPKLFERLVPHIHIREE